MRTLFGMTLAMLLALVQSSLADDKNEPGKQAQKGVIKLPKNVPGWFSGKVKNLNDIEYDLSSSSNGAGASDPGGNGSSGTGPSGNGAGGNGAGGNGAGGNGAGGNGAGGNGAGGNGAGGNGSGGNGPGGNGAGGGEGQGDTMADDVTEKSLKDLSAWKDLLSFRAPKSVQESVQSIGKSWTIHRVEDGTGDVNLDYYPITIEKLPTVNGKQLSGAELLDLIRQNINDFVNTDYCSFAPFKKSDLEKWKSSNATGTNIQIDVKLTEGVIDLAMVVTAKHTSSEWVFSTVRGGSGYFAINNRDRPGAHPVSGNRAFGFHQNDSGSLVFYVMGADRATRLMDRLGSPLGFYYADQLWKSYQEKVAEFVNRNGGSAKVDTANTISNRHDWDKVKIDPTIYDTSNQPNWVPLPKGFR